MLQNRHKIVNLQIHTPEINTWTLKAKFKQMNKIGIYFLEGNQLADEE